MRKFFRAASFRDNCIPLFTQSLSGEGRTRSRTSLFPPLFFSFPPLRRAISARSVRSTPAWPSGLRRTVWSPSPPLLLREIPDGFHRTRYGVRSRCPPFFFSSLPGADRLPQSLIRGSGRLLERPAVRERGLLCFPLSFFYYTGIAHSTTRRVLLSFFSFFDHCVGQQKALSPSSGLFPPFLSLLFFSQRIGAGIGPLAFFSLPQWVIHDRQQTVVAMERSCYTFLSFMRTARGFDLVRRSGIASLSPLLSSHSTSFQLRRSHCVGPQLLPKAPTAPLPLSSFFKSSGSTGENSFLFFFPFLFSFSDQGGRHNESCFRDRSRLSFPFPFLRAHAPPPPPPPLLLVS